MHLKYTYYCTFTFLHLNTYYCTFTFLHLKYTYYCTFTFLHLKYTHYCTFTFLTLNTHTTVLSRVCTFTHTTVLSRFCTLNTHTTVLYIKCIHLIQTITRTCVSVIYIFLNSHMSNDHAQCCVTFSEDVDLHHHGNMLNLTTNTLYHQQLYFHQLFLP